MGEPDIVEFGSLPGRRRWWRWAIVIAAVLSALALVIVHNRQVHRAAAVQHLITTPAGPPLVSTYGYGYQIKGHQLVFALNLRNIGRAPTSLDRPQVSPSSGATITSIGFENGTDLSATVSTGVTLPVGGTTQLMVRYTVDCAAVRAPWPYLGGFTVRLANSSGSSSTRLQLPTMPSMPSPLPCAPSKDSG
jgi:hypothetical protein